MSRLWVAISIPLVGIRYLPFPLPKPSPPTPHQLTMQPTPGLRPPHRHPLRLHPGPHPLEITRPLLPPHRHSLPKDLPRSRQLRTRRRPPSHNSLPPISHPAPAQRIKTLERNSPPRRNPVLDPPLLSPSQTRCYYHPWFSASG